jgi:hypothetical protein
MNTPDTPLTSENDPVQRVHVSRSDQAQSSFFSKIPAEIRISTYHYLIAPLGEAIHIQKKLTKQEYGRSISTVCRVEKRFEEWEADYAYHNYSGDIDHRPCLRVLSECARQDKEISKTTLHATRPNAKVAIMLTCSKAYVAVLLP